MTNKKKIDPIPRELNSYEEAAEFWDAHDTTDYMEQSRPVRSKASSADVFTKLPLMKVWPRFYGKQRNKKASPQAASQMICCARGWFRVRSSHQIHQTEQLMKEMMKKLISKLVHHGEYVAEVDVELLYTDDEWSPYLSVEDAAKLDDVREALRRKDFASV